MMQFISGTPIRVINDWSNKETNQKDNQEKETTKETKKRKNAQESFSSESCQIKLFPNSEERLKLNQWMGTARWTS